MRKNLYIIGARGFGRECVGHFRSWPGFLDQYNIKGFLDDKKDALDGYVGYPSIVDSVENFKPRDGDVFLCALGAVEWRFKYINVLRSKGAFFPTIISPRANVHATAHIGDGVLVLDNSMISSDVSVGRDVLCNVNVVIGHDVVIGDGCVLESFVFCGGYARINSGVTLHTRATVLPKVTIGKCSVVGACSCVLKDVRPNRQVFGVPAMSF